jgi:predicted MFS family arabinose efflux permease
VAAIVAALIWLTESRGRDRGVAAGRLDIGGAIAVTAGLGALIYAIVGTQSHAWGSVQTLSLLGAAAVLLAAFAVIELRVARTPLMPFGLLRSRSVAGANAVMFLVGAAFFSMWYFLSLYLQNVLGYSALKTGLAFLPMGITIIAGAQASSRILPRAGVRPLLLAGTLLAGAGFAWLSAITPHGSYWVHVFGPGCLISLALGLLFTPLAAAATAGVPFTEAGLASGVLNTSRQIGGSLGLAVLATIATDRSRAMLTSGGRALSPADVLNSGYARAFECAAALVLAAFAASFVVPAIRARTSRAAPAREAGPAGPPGPESPDGPAGPDAGPLEAGAGR